MVARIDQPTNGQRRSSTLPPVMRSSRLTSSRLSKGLPAPAAKKHNDRQSAITGQHPRV